MLVTFETRQHASVIMFGDIAQSLLRMMGCSGQVPGALVPEDVGPALAQLRKSLHTQDDDAAGGDDGSDDDDADDKQPISIHTRAGPLLALLEAAERERDSVMWRSQAH